MTDAETHPSRGVPATSLRSTAVVAVAAVVVLLVASFAGRALVNWTQRSVGTGGPAIQERAYFVDPSNVNVGVTLLVQFVIVPSTAKPVTWTADNAGHQVRNGSAQGPAGSDVVVTLPTAQLRHGSWLTVTVSGIATPLRAWVT